jgi:hypothetical protein
MTVLLAFALSITAAPSTAQPRGAAPAGLHVVPAVVVDPTGFERPMGAATLFLPIGWRTEGGIEWGQERMCTNGFALNWRAVSPDGWMSVALLPQHAWSASNFGAPPSRPGCANEPNANVRQYLERTVRTYWPGARVLQFRLREDLRRESGQAEQVVPMPLGNLRRWSEAGEILFGFRVNGVDLRGSVATVVDFESMRMDAGTGPMMSLNALAHAAWAAIAPPERMDLNFFEALRRSFQVNPEWRRRITSHNLTIARGALQESRKRAAMIRQSNEEISRIRQETWSAYQDSAERRARQFSDALRGIQRYDDPNAATGQTELSNRYNHAWRLQDGTFFLTNDAGFDPWRDLRVAGQRLNPSAR